MYVLRTRYANVVDAVKPIYSTLLTFDLRVALYRADKVIYISRGITYERYQIR